MPSANIRSETYLEKPDEATKELEAEILIYEGLLKNGPGPLRNDEALQASLAQLTLLLDELQKQVAKRSSYASKVARDKRPSNPTKKNASRDEEAYINLKLELNTFRTTLSNLLHSLTEKTDSLRGTYHMHITRSMETLQRLYATVLNGNGKLEDFYHQCLQLTDATSFFSVQARLRNAGSAELDDLLAEKKVSSFSNAADLNWADKVAILLKNPGETVMAIKDQVKAEIKEQIGKVPSPELINEESAPRIEAALKKMESYFNSLCERAEKDDILAQEEIDMALATLQRSPKFWYAESAKTVEARRESLPSEQLQRLNKIASHLETEQFTNAADELKELPSYVRDNLGLFFNPDDPADQGILIQLKKAMTDSNPAFRDARKHGLRATIYTDHESDDEQSDIRINKP